ncbi:MHC class I-like protein [White-tailed deer poxvirus]|nr:MHC class I-like protein [White-tailed deer poxvirus]
MNINMMFVVFLIFTIPYIILSYDQNEDSTLTHQYTIYIDNNNNTIFSFVGIINDDIIFDSFTKTFLENFTEIDIKKDLNGLLPFGLYQLVLYLVQFVSVENNNKINNDENILQWIMSCKISGGGYNNYFHNNNYFYTVYNSTSVTYTKNMTTDFSITFMYAVKTYLNEQCIIKLTNLTSNENIIKYTKKPNIYINKFTMNNTIILTCYAFGYYPKKILMNWNKNIKNVINSLPSGDNMYQSWSSISLNSSHIESKYTCHVYHNNYHFEVTAYIEKDINIIFLIIPILIIMLFLIAAIAYKFYPFSENIYKKMYK